MLFNTIHESLEVRPRGNILHDLKKSRLRGFCEFRAAHVMEGIQTAGISPRYRRHLLPFKGGKFGAV